MAKEFDTTQRWPVPQDFDYSCLQKLLASYPNLMAYLASVEPQTRNSSHYDLPALDEFRYLTLPARIEARQDGIATKAEIPLAEISKPLCHGWIDLNELKELVEFKL